MIIPLSHGRCSCAQPSRAAPAHDVPFVFLPDTPFPFRGFLESVLHVQQPSIAKMERRTDMYISTLRSHIEAMGGELEVVARFPDGAVKITNFSDIESAKA